jgi:hypothetical protein
MARYGSYLSPPHQAYHHPVDGHLLGPCALMSRSSQPVLLAIVAAALTGICVGQTIHIVLRPSEGRTSFHLGQPIVLEAACIDPVSQQYLSPCVVVLRAEPSSPGARLSADRIDQTTWLDAISGDLPPKPRGVCGTISSLLPSQPSQRPDWRTVTLEEPFPVHPGEYKLRADLAYDLEISDRFGVPQMHSFSDEVEISVDDNLSWKHHLMHFSKCDYDVRLTLIPDSDAVAALRKHLDDCAVTWPEPYAMLLHENVWLRMQVERPELYARMQELEHIRLPFRGEDEAELQKAELEQARLSAASDAGQIREFFHDRYRELLLETAQQLVAAYKSHPELRASEDFEGDLEDGFGNWYDAAATLIGGADSYVTPDEVTNFLKQAGRSPSYISAFLKEHKSDLPLQLPEYKREGADFSPE